jgi:tetratricopeptide (TPR) repeat protein
MQGRAEDAAPLLRKLCEEARTRSEYWVLCANTEMMRNDNRAAIVLLECARRLSGMDRQSLLALGDLYFNEGLYGKAVLCYSEANARDKLPTASIVRYAEALLDAGRPTLAEELIGAAAPEDGKGGAGLHVTRARIALANGDAASAKARLDDFLRRSPMNGDALLMLAGIEKEAGESERALLTLERASRVETHKRRALLETAQIYVERTQYGKALESLEEAQSLQFDPRVARYAEEIRRAKASLE